MPGNSAGNILSWKQDHFQIPFEDGCLDPQSMRPTSVKFGEVAKESTWLRFGGFNYSLCSHLPGEDFTPIWRLHIFFEMGWWKTANPDHHLVVSRRHPTRCPGLPPALCRLGSPAVHRDTGGSWWIHLSKLGWDTPCCTGWWFQFFLISIPT